MINFNEHEFQKTLFSSEQLARYLDSAKRELNIAAESTIPDVIFKFTYDALLKLGIYFIAKSGYKVRSRAGHHSVIIEKLAELLTDNDIAVLGNKMRQERNIGLYAGGLSVSEKEAKEYLDFIKAVFRKTPK